MLKHQARKQVVGGLSIKQMVSLNMYPADGIDIDTELAKIKETVKLYTSLIHLNDVLNLNLKSRLLRNR